MVTFNDPTGSGYDDRVFIFDNGFSHSCGVACCHSQSIYFAPFASSEGRKASQARYMSLADVRC